MPALGRAGQFLPHPWRCLGCLVGCWVHSPLPLSLYPCRLSFTWSRGSSNPPQTYQLQALMDSSFSSPMQVYTDP